MVGFPTGMICLKQLHAARKLFLILWDYSEDVCDLPVKKMADRRLHENAGTHGRVLNPPMFFLHAGFQNQPGNLLLMRSFSKNALRIIFIKLPPATCQLAGL
jgi:hypothetical protein